MSVSSSRLLALITFDDQIVVWNEDAETAVVVGEGQDPQWVEERTEGGG